MIIPPAYSYSGITLILSYPSRFDSKDKLLQGWAGQYVEIQLRRKLFNCELRTVEEDAPFRSGTILVFLFGELAKNKYIGNTISLNQQRGYPVFKDGLIFLATYFPQDAMDIVGDYEDLYNTNKSISEYSEDETDPFADKTTKGATKRSNYRFWLKADLEKGIRLLEYAKNGTLELMRDKEKIIHRPKLYLDFSMEEVVTQLEQARNQNIFLDIETLPDYSQSCCGFAIGNGDVYVVPIFRYDKSLAFDPIWICRFFRALATAFKNNRIIVHNAMYDLYMFAMKYKIPFGFDNYCTMLSFTRCFVGIEKSLGHVISYLLDFEEYHKNDGVFDPKNEQEEKDLWTYNGKDVATLRKVYEKLELLATSKKGLRQSIDQINSSIAPFLFMKCFGILTDLELREKLVKENLGKLQEIQRLINLLVGYPLLPTSSPACVKYFHQFLGWKAVELSKKTNKPKLGKQQLYTLALSNADHPIIKLVLAYRRIQKETSDINYRLFHETQTNPINSESTITT